MIFRSNNSLRGRLGSFKMKGSYTSQISILLISLVLLAALPSHSAILSNQGRLDRIIANSNPRNTVDPKDVLEHGSLAGSFSFEEENFNNSDDLQNLSKSTDSTQAHLWDSIPNIWANYYSIPWEMLNPSDLNELGLNQFTENGRFFDVKFLGPSFALTIPFDDNGLFIPGNTSLLFLFNTSRVNEGSKKHMEDIVLNEGNEFRSNNKQSSNAIVQTSLPFGLPKYHYVEQYSLLVPKHLIDIDQRLVSVLSGDNWVRKIGLRRVAIPLPNNMLQANGPVLAFVFKSGESLADFVEDESPEYTNVAKILAMEEEIEQKYKYMFDNATVFPNSTGPSQMARKEYYQAKLKLTNSLIKTSSDIAKAVLSSSSTFFDNFSKRWASKVGVESLQHSTFCQVNIRFHEQSYCLKFDSDGSAVVSLLSVPSDKLNSDHSDSHLAKRDWDSIEAYTSGKKEDFVDSVQAASEKLSDVMGAVHDYAYALGEKTDGAYKSLKYRIKSKLGKLN